MASLEPPVSQPFTRTAHPRSWPGQVDRPPAPRHLGLVPAILRTALPDITVESEPEVTGWARVIFALLALLWIASNVVFWGWWLRPEHVASPGLYALFTLAFGYEATLLPSIYLYYVGRMRRPKPVSPSDHLRVAVITLCVPTSESLDVIVLQLEAMSRVTYPHDSWVLDEGGDPMVRAAADRLGVRYFSRAGVTRYNRSTPPFTAKTKAGNVNAWLDAHGHQYDYFVQLDIDHLPEPDYLDQVLGYFRDPRVAWVQAPSLYGNLENWVARGAAEQELVLQGPLQQGFFGATDTPFIIGSHSAYRTAAIREIGGFQPTRAEDHLDTVVLASRGYRGVFVPRVLAVGSGPDTFETYLRQQFAWAYSMMQVFFSYTPSLVWKYRPLQALQFLFAQTWYICWSTSVALLFFMPMLSLLTGKSVSTVSLLEFAAACAPMGATAFVTWWWTRRWHRPVGLRLSWRGVVLHVARWPIVLWALFNVILRVKHPYMITPKGSTDGVPRFSLRSQLLYLSLVWIPLGIIAGYQAGWWGTPPEWDPFDPSVPSVDGAILLALWGIAFMALVVITNVGAYLSQLSRAHVSFVLAARAACAPAVALGVTLVGVSATLTAGTDQIVAAATVLESSRTTTEMTGTLAGRALLRLAAAEPGTEVVAETEAAVEPGTEASVEPGTEASVEPGTEAVAETETQVVAEAGPGGAVVGLHVALPLPPGSPPDDRAPTTAGAAQATSPAAAPVPGTVAALPPAVAALPRSPAIRPFDLPTESVAFGMYDPWQAATGLQLDLEHWYIRQDEPRLLQGALRRTRDRKIALVTVEPFPARGDRTPVLDVIVAGHRDAELRRLAQIARSASPQVLLMRWGHEMELSGLYPWSANHPQLYVEAYRHVVEVFREEGADNVRWVWSPAGNAGLEAFYPGDDVVDYVGVTVLGDPGWDANFGLPPQSFDELLGPKYERLAIYQKPIIVAELGVSGTPERQALWLEEAATSVDHFPLVRALSYFNDVNAENNRLSSRPDWRVDAGIFLAFVDHARSTVSAETLGGSSDSAR